MISIIETIKFEYTHRSIMCCIIHYGLKLVNLLCLTSYHIYPRPPPHIPLPCPRPLEVGNLLWGAGTRYQEGVSLWRAAGKGASGEEGEKDCGN